MTEKQRIQVLSLEGAPLQLLVLPVRNLWGVSVCVASARLLCTDEEAHKVYVLKLAGGSRHT